MARIDPQPNYHPSLSRVSETGSTTTTTWASWLGVHLHTLDQLSMAWPPLSHFLPQPKLTWKPFEFQFPWQHSIRRISQLEKEHSNSISPLPFTTNPNLIILYAPNPCLLISPTSKSNPSPTPLIIIITTTITITITITTIITTIATAMIASLPDLSKVSFDLPRQSNGTIWRIFCESTCSCVAVPLCYLSVLPLPLTWFPSLQSSLFSIFSPSLLFP